MELEIGKRYLITNMRIPVEIIVLEVSPDGRFAKALAVDTGEKEWIKIRDITAFLPLPPLPGQSRFAP